MSGSPDRGGWRSSCSGAIFDFEGTLVDFQWQLEPAEEELRRAYAELGFAGEAFAGGNYATLWNAAADRVHSSAGLSALRAALGPIYDRWDADALARWAPRPGAQQLLRQLVASGSRVGMVSNIGRATLDVALARFDFAPSLSPVVSRDDVRFMKPRAEGVLRVLGQWQLDPGDVLFVGDSRTDVLCARTAGLPVAIVRGGECHESAFGDLPPDLWISRLDELVERVVRC